jgi:hypothetical protein
MLADTKPRPHTNHHYLQHQDKPVLAVVITNEAQLPMMRNDAKMTCKRWQHSPKVCFCVRLGGEGGLHLWNFLEAIHALSSNYM